MEPNGLDLLPYLAFGTAFGAVTFVWTHWGRGVPGRYALLVSLPMPAVCVLVPAIGPALHGDPFALACLLASVVAIAACMGARYRFVAAGDADPDPARPHGLRERFERLWFGGQGPTRRAPGMDQRSPAVADRGGAAPALTSQGRSLTMGWMPERRGMNEGEPVTTISELRGRWGARSGWVALGLSALVLLAVAVVLQWDDGGAAFAGAAAILAAVPLVLLGLPALASRRGRKPVVWIVLGVLLDPILAAVLLLVLPSVPAPDAQIA